MSRQQQRFIQTQEIGNKYKLIRKWQQFVPDNYQENHQTPSD